MGVLDLHFACNFCQPYTNNMLEIKLSENAIENLKDAVQIHELLDFSEDLNFHFVDDMIHIQSYHSTHNLIISFKFGDKKLVVSDSSDETVVTVKRSNFKRVLDYVTEFFPRTLKYEKDTIKFIMNSSQIAYNLVSIKAKSWYKLKVPIIYGCKMRGKELYDICDSFGQSSLFNISFNENGVIFSNSDSDEVNAEYISFSKENNKDESTILNEKTISHQIPVSFVKRIAEVFPEENFFSSVVVGFQPKAEESEYALLIEYDVRSGFCKSIFDSIKKNFSSKYNVSSLLSVN